MTDSPAMTHPSLVGAAPTPYWLDDTLRPDPTDPLTGPAGADLVVVGGGYLGLWTALLAVTRDPGRDVLVLEAGTCGHAASGRNGGFCEASLTHGFGNGHARWPDELAALLRLGRENLDAIGATIAEEGIDCDFLHAGALSVATLPEQVAGLAEEQAQAAAYGQVLTLLDAADVRERVASPTYLGALHDPDSAILEPARLAWGLREACLRRGVRIAEHTPALGLGRARSGTVRGAMEVRTSVGTVSARRVVLATNAFRPLLRRLRLMTVPVYDYALMSEPLSAEQRAAIGWSGREGVGDRANQFHYYRTTRDGRIL
ncbi:MAG: FAD-dependent oxidoreductase [Marmoricola sp.]|nr:FAD-dependent oxidoreductase [Marmoricola sp.]